MTPEANTSEKLEVQRAGCLKLRTELLVRDLGLLAACDVVGKSKTTIGRYYSVNPEDADRFMPIDMVARLEGVASFAYVSSALANMKQLAASAPSNISPEPAADMPIVVAELSEQVGELTGELLRAGFTSLPSRNQKRSYLERIAGLERVLGELKRHFDS